MKASAPRVLLAGTGSGCGKTTLIKLLLGYFEDYGGSIRYDGRELRALDMDKIAGIISVIHQNVYLFNLSVRENILLFEEFDEAALAEAGVAVCLAAAPKDVMSEMYRLEGMKCVG